MFNLLQFGDYYAHGFGLLDSSRSSLLSFPAKTLEQLFSRS